MRLFSRPNPSEPESESLPMNISPSDMGVATTEPKLTQLDPESRELLLNCLYEYGFVKDPETGDVKRMVTKCKYPEIEPALAYAASHLNSVMNYTWAHGRAMIMFFEGLFYDPLNLYYEDNQEAQRILDTLHQMLTRAILGGSVGGTHQAYNVRMAGAHRTFEVVKPER